MPVKTILVNGGLVTSRDPSLLAEGELQQADDSRYLPGNPALFKGLGRTASDSAGEGATAIDGLAFAQFDGATDLLVKMQGQKYYTSTAGITTSWTSRQTGLSSSATQLNSVHYLNEHYLLNGYDRHALQSDATTRQHGMAPIETAPTLVATAAGDVTTVTGLKYWTTELVKSGSTVLRESEATSAAVSATTGVLASKKVVITKPDTVNSDATHWRVYVTSDGGSYATGGLITDDTTSSTDINIATTEATDNRSDVTIPSTAYPIVTVSIAGVSNSVSKNTRPPLADVGDIFEDSLVTNDTSDVTRVRYSFPDNPDVFPSVYFIGLETKRSDEVTNIVQVGNVLLVFTREQVWRINYLPREQDAEFDRGRARDRVSGALGCISKRGATVFEMPGAGPMVAYISASGPMVTKGWSWDTLTDDIDWEGTVNIGQLSRCILTNNPRYYRLELDYPAIGSLTNNRTLYFHYHPTHLKAGAIATTRTESRGIKLKVTGPNRRTAASIAGGFIGDEWKTWAGDTSDGKTYNEDTGDKDNSGAGGIQFAWKLGDLYLAEHGNEFKLNRFGIHHQADSATYKHTITASLLREGASPTTRSKAVDLSKRELTMEAFSHNGEALQLGGANANDDEPTSVDYCVIDADGMGKSEE